MSEAELGAALFNIMMEEGFHGVTRFGMFDTEMIFGQIGFETVPYTHLISMVLRTYRTQSGCTGSGDPGKAAQKRRPCFCRYRFWG